MEVNEILAEEVSKVIDQPIGVEHIHPTTDGRFFYTQAPRKGAPMLLHHYRGPFFIDIHPEDLEYISSGKVSAHEYITSANWLIGYYWGGGSMISGGYYQPMDIIGCKERVQRYLKILACRGFYKSCGYMPSKEACESCSLVSCPLSKYKEGSWDEEEITEDDPRIDFFNALNERFKRENPGCKLQGFLCSKIPEREIWVMPNVRYRKSDPYTLTAYASSSVIQSLLMHEEVPTVDKFTFRIYQLGKEGTLDATPENIAKACEGKDYSK